MDKKWITLRISGAIDEAMDPDLLIEDRNGIAKIYANDISQAHEEDKWDALKVLGETWGDVVDEHLATIAQLRTQVATMAELLGRCKWAIEIIQEEGIDFTEGFRAEIDKALQSAPPPLEE